MGRGFMEDVAFMLGLGRRDKMLIDEVEGRTFQRKFCRMTEKNTRGQTNTPREDASQLGSLRGPAPRWGLQYNDIRRHRA